MGPDGNSEAVSPPYEVSSTADVIRTETLVNDVEVFSEAAERDVDRNGKTIGNQYGLVSPTPRL